MTWIVLMLTCMTIQPHDFRLAESEAALSDCATTPAIPAPQWAGLAIPEQEPRPHGEAVVAITDWFVPQLSGTKDDAMLVWLTAAPPRYDDAPQPPATLTPEPRTGVVMLVFAVAMFLWSRRRRR